MPKETRHTLPKEQPGASSWPGTKGPGLVPSTSDAPGPALTPSERSPPLSLPHPTFQGTQGLHLKGVSETCSPNPLSYK